MKIAPVADVKARFSKYLTECLEGPVIVTKDGRPAAVLVAAPGAQELERLVLAHAPRFMALLESAEERIRKGKGLRHGAFWRSVQTRRGSGRQRAA